MEKEKGKENSFNSFNKRISLAKRQVFNSLSLSKELEAIRGSKQQGYYSLATILKALHEALYDQNLDFDLELHEDKCIGHWYDTMSDKERLFIVDFNRIKEVERLQMMANVVQSEGAVKTYTRRYALTAILNLPSTDLIDSNNNANNTRNNNNSNTNNINNSNTNNSNNSNSDSSNTANGKVSQAQLKRYFAIAKSKNMNIEKLDALVKEAFKLKSKNDLSVEDYKRLTDFMSENEGEKTILMLKKKKQQKKK